MVYGAAFLGEPGLNTMSSLRQRISTFLHEDPLLRRLLKNTGYMFSSSTISMVFVAIQSVLAARLLGVNTLGLITVAMTFVTMVNQLFSFRMGEFVVRYLSKALSEKNFEHAGAVVKTSILVETTTSIIAFGFMLLIAPLGAKYAAKDPNSLYLFQLYALAILANFATETSNGVLRVLNHYKVQGWITLIQSGITFTSITLAFIFHGSVLFILLAYLIGKIFLGTSPIMVAMKKMKEEVSVDWWKNKTSILPELKEMSHFAISTNLSGTLKLIVSESEPLWVGLFLNTHAVGLYKVAMAVVGLMIIPITPFNFTAFPEITQSVVSKLWTQLRNLLRRITLLSVLWTVSVTLFMVFFGKWLIGIYGPEFPQAFPTLLILLAGFGFSNIYFWNRSLLLSFGKANIPLYIMAVAGLLKIGLSFFLVPKFGVNAEAALLSGYFILSTGLMILIGYNMIRKSELKEIPAEAA
jgi:O-antigen/teichoic acid export membrane protein